MGDEPLPPNFDPNELVDEPMSPVEKPSKGNKSGNEDQGSQRDCPDNVEDFMHPWDLLKRHIFAGSCCTGVAVLYALSSWDHGWIPGLASQFALSSDLQELRQETSETKKDVAEMYILFIARAIRDQKAELCIAPSQFKADQMDLLQRKYKERTGDWYPVTECPPSHAAKGTNGA
jgi:hypothetical protein